MTLNLLVVTDLDDTIYDWLGFYVPSFRAMLREVERISGVPAKRLIPAFRRVHQRHGTTEYAFSIEELDVLPPVETEDDLRARLERFASAIRSFRNKRAELLRPYPGVQETLEYLETRGIPVVACSDSTIEYVSRRLRQLDLDRRFTAVYAPQDHGIPARFPPSALRKKELAAVRARTDHRPIEKGRRKPDPEILTRIARDFGCPIRRTVYVGDSLSRDVRMAQEAGAIDVWARYGTHKASDELEFLKSISYWTDEHMDAAEGTAAPHEQPAPRFVINCFSDLRQILAVVQDQRSSLSPSPE